MAGILGVILGAVFPAIFLVIPRAWARYTARHVQAPWPRVALLPNCTRLRATLRGDVVVKERGFDPLALDLSALCKHDGAVQGQWPLAGMARLAESFSAATDANTAWQARGRLVPVTGGEAELWLDLQANAEVPLECQRCLQPMVERLQVRRQFRFVRHEDEAARLDEESEDDVLVLPARLDLHALVEDELILALPIVPRHDTCPTPLPMSAADVFEEEEPAPNPFAALAALRRPPGGG